MARKTRDYAKEYQRRQALAKTRGFDSYGAQRYAIEKGRAPAIQSWRIRLKSTAEAQQEFFARAKRDPDKGLYAREVAKVTKEQQCRDWSAGHAKYAIFKFTPRDARRLGMTKAQYIETYYKTFVDGDSRYALVRKKKGDYRALRHWLVDLHDYMDADEFDQKYTVNA